MDGRAIKIKWKWCIVSWFSNW